MRTHAHDVEYLLTEILVSVRRPTGTAVGCDCCRLCREATDFDEDGCGICLTWLECDDILWEWRRIGCAVQPSMTG